MQNRDSQGQRRGFHICRREAPQVVRTIVVCKFWRENTPAFNCPLITEHAQWTSGGAKCWELFSIRWSKKRQDNAFLNSNSLPLPTMQDIFNFFRLLILPHTELLSFLEMVSHFGRLQDNSLTAILPLSYLGSYFSLSFLVQKAADSRLRSNAVFAMALPPSQCVWVDEWVDMCWLKSRLRTQPRLQKLKWFHAHFKRPTAFPV